jgi:hypothetical protein
MLVDERLDYFEVSFLVIGKIVHGLAFDLDGLDSGTGFGAAEPLFSVQGH